jgi:class 3 adenylate cyclase
VAVYSDSTELKQRENQLAEKSKALEQLSSQLAKYLSPQVYESMFSGKQEVKIASRRKKLTVFFSDIAGFTETEDLTQLLDHYLTEMSEIALFYGATIDKYVGDAIVIFFGDAETRGVKEDAVACIEMAIVATCGFQQGRYADAHELFAQAAAADSTELEYQVKRDLCERLARRSQTRS